MSGADRIKPCVFPGCVSTDRHWHGPFSGGYENPDDPEGPPIEFTGEPAPGVRDYNGALLSCPHGIPMENVAYCAECRKGFWESIAEQARAALKEQPR